MGAGDFRPCYCGCQTTYQTWPIGKVEVVAPKSDEEQRDDFAEAAMPVVARFLEQKFGGLSEQAVDLIAGWSYKLSDSMMKARSPATSPSREKGEAGR